jgi:hypothetical protein
LRRISILFALALAAGCDSDGNSRVVGQADGGVADGARSDGAARDARVTDASGEDSGPRDGAVARDGGARDAAIDFDANLDALLPTDGTAGDASSPLDRGAPPDTAVDAESVTDAAVADAIPVDGAAMSDAARPACEGVPLPPAPDSPDGSEVCNYRDDDGDGLVDEGFAYEVLEPQSGRIIPGSQRMDMPADFEMKWSGDGYGLAWAANGIVNFVKIDEHGCRSGPHHPLDQNPEDRGAAIFPGSLDLEYSGGRFALTFTQLRQERAGQPGGIGTFLYLFERDGALAAGPIDLDPTLNFGASNAIAALGDQFGVFASAFDRAGQLTSSYYALFNRDGHSIHGAVETFSEARGGLPFNELIGLASDGDGFGLAWTTSLPGRGAADVAFMRWSADGRILTEPQILLAGTSDAAGLAWTGDHFAVPYSSGHGAFVAFVRPDGVVERSSELGRRPDGAALWYRLTSSASQILAYTAAPTASLFRVSESGQILGDPVARRRFLVAFSTDGAGGIGMIELEGVPPEWETLSYYLRFRRIGCARE